MSDFEKKESVLNSVESPTIISPYGGRLINLLLEGQAAEEIKELAGSLPWLVLSERSVCDLEMLALGAFSPLDRFMSKEDYERVLAEMRLGSGDIFPMPLSLPVDLDAVGFQLQLDKKVALRDSHN